MKLTSHEEYGLRCLLRLAHVGAHRSLTIPEISKAEGISTAYVAKLMRIMRRCGFVTATRGKIGGYTLARRADEIVVGEVLAVLGGRLFEGDFCESHSGDMTICTHSIDCSLRSLWRAVQTVVDQVLSKTTLQDMLRSEPEMTALVTSVSNYPLVELKRPRSLPRA